VRVDSSNKLAQNDIDVSSTETIVSYPYTSLNGVSCVEDWVL